MSTRTVAEILADIPLMGGSDEGCAAWDWKNLVMPQLERNQIDPRFARKIDKWGCKPQEAVFKACQAQCSGRGAIVALAGRRGAGKTTVATQLIIRRVVAAIEAQKLPPWLPYRKLSGLTSRFKPLFADFGALDIDGLSRGMEALCGAELLIIDEIHDCEDMKTGNRILTDICDRRYSRMKDTILISNREPCDFAKAAGDSIVSRICEHGLIIPCNWKSFRAPNR